MIPTMYKGDQLVFKTSQALTEKVYIERFEYEVIPSEYPDLLKPHPEGTA